MLAMNVELAQAVQFLQKLHEQEEKNRAEMRKNLRLWGYYLRSENESCIAQQTGQIKANLIQLLKGGVVSAPELSDAEKAQAEKLHQKIAGLNCTNADHYRVLLKLHYVNNVPQTAIAMIYRKNYSTVKRWFESIVDRLILA